MRFRRRPSGDHPSGVSVGREIALTIGAVVGAVCLLAAIGGLFFGITPLVFRSGSMAPSIGTGALGLAREVPAADLREGDVVSVINDSGTRITHRIENIDQVDDSTARLVLKGDANQVSDLTPSYVTSADRVFFHVERLGYVVSWFSSAGAAFLGGVIVGVLLMVGFRPTPVRGDSPGRGYASEDRPKPVPGFAPVEVEKEVVRS